MIIFKNNLSEPIDNNQLNILDTFKIQSRVVPIKLNEEIITTTVFGNVPIKILSYLDQQTIIYIKSIIINNIQINVFMTLYGSFVFLRTTSDSLYRCDYCLPNYIIDAVLDNGPCSIYNVINVKVNKNIKLNSKLEEKLEIFKLHATHLYGEGNFTTYNISETTCELYFKFPKIFIHNSKEEYKLIYDFIIRFKITLVDDIIIYDGSGNTAARGKFTYNDKAKYNYFYSHSHIPIPYSHFDYKEICLGESAIGQILVHMTSEVTEDLIIAFLYQLPEHVMYESTEGGPHINIQQFLNIEPITSIFNLNEPFKILTDYIDSEELNFNDCILPKYDYHKYTLLFSAKPILEIDTLKDKLSNIRINSLESNYYSNNLKCQVNVASLKKGKDDALEFIRYGETIISILLTTMSKEDYNLELEKNKIVNNVINDNVFIIYNSNLMNKLQLYFEDKLLEKIKTLFNKNYDNYTNYIKPFLSENIN